MSSKLGVFNLCSVGPFDVLGGGKVNSLKAFPCPGFSQNSFLLPVLHIEVLIKLF